jgi:hypothetical protein
MTPQAFSLSLLALAFASASPAAAQDAAPILNRVDVERFVTSTAPADQAALAAHFRALADRAAADASRHQAMARAVPGGPRTDPAAMKAHCERLSRLGLEAEGTLRELAAHHAALAGGSASAAPAKGAKYQAGEGARKPSPEDAAALARRPATPDTHRALQAYFESFARDYRDQAAVHAAMATHYRTTSRLAPVAAHCDRLIERFQAIATEAEQAAAMHRSLAGK